MSVVAGSLGVRGKFVRELVDNGARTNANEVEGETEIRTDFSFDMASMNQTASPALQQTFNEAICINSTAFEDTNEDGVVEFVGSKTETALLRFAKELGWQNYRQVREGAQVVQMIPFSSELKAMGVVVKKANGKGWRVYLKGASEILSKNCTRHVVVSDNNDGDHDSSATGDKVPGITRDGDSVETADFDHQSMSNISKTIIFYANQSLRTIALCYRDFESWPPTDALSHSDKKSASGPGGKDGAEDDGNADDVPFTYLARDLTLIAITGIEDPLRPGVREAVEKCQRAGVGVKMCTGDNVLTARSIANQCGIFTTGGIIMEGPVFRKVGTLLKTIDSHLHIQRPTSHYLAHLASHPFSPCPPLFLACSPLNLYCHFQ